MIVRSPDVSSVLFRMPVWAIGNPLVTDSAPTSVEPPANRITTIDPEALRAVLRESGALIRVIAIGGTSIAYRPWTYDQTRSAWIFIGGIRTITLASSNIDFAANFSMGSIVGAKLFLQITSVVGAVTNFGYGVT